MAHKILVLVVAFVLSAEWVAAQVQACPDLVESALSRTQDVCTDLRGNQACYGYQLLDAELSSDLSTNPFENVGDKTPVGSIHSLSLSPLDVTKNIWGVALLRLRFDSVDAVAAHTATLIAFGGTTLLADTSGQYLPMQAFTFRSDGAGSECSEVVENGLLIQTPDGVGRMTFWVNQVKISIGSTILFQAQPSGEMVISTFEGSALVEAYGQTQEAAAGMQIRVPMDANLQPAAPPMMSEPFDSEGVGLSALLILSQQLTEGDITETFTLDSVQPTIETIIQPVVETLVILPTPISAPPSVAPPLVQGQQMTPTITALVPTIATETWTFTPEVTTTETLVTLPTIFVTGTVLAPTATSTIPIQLPASEVNSVGVTPISVSTEASPTFISPTSTLISPLPTAVLISPTPGSEAIITTATATDYSDIEESTSTFAPPELTSTPEIIALPTTDAPVSSPTLANPDIVPIWTATAPVYPEESATPADCNGDHGNGEPNGHCYGHTK